MDCRANFVLVDDQGWQLHHARNGARWICSLLVRGPLATHHAIASLPRVAEREHGWYGDSLAQAGAVLDVPRRRLLYHSDTGGTYDTVELRLFRRLLRRVWRDWGWRVRWAYDGPGDLVAAVGLDRSLVRTARHRAPPQTVSTDPGVPAHLLTVRGADESLRAWTLPPDEHSGWHGPALLDRPPGAGDTRPRLGAVPESGTHVDVPRRTVGVWTGTVAPGLLPALAGLWPGWRTEFWGDRHEQQLLACTGAVSVPATDPRAALHSVLDQLATGYGDAIRAGVRASRADRAPGYVGRRTSTLWDAEQPPPEEKDWYWAGRAAGYLLSETEREHTEPETPPWMRRIRPAPSLIDFLRARLDEQEQHLTGAARFENNLRGYEYWHRTGGAVMRPQPDYRHEVTYWPEWRVQVPENDSRTGLPRLDPLRVGPYDLRNPAGLALTTEQWRQDAAHAGAHLAQYAPARARADLAARRALLDQYSETEAELGRVRRERAAGTAPETALVAARARWYSLFLALRRLAGAYADHRDHDPEWPLPAGGPYRG